MQIFVGSLAVLISTLFFSAHAQESIPPNAIPFGNDHYVGETVDGIPEGRGTLYQEGVTVDGTFKNGAPDGIVKVTGDGLEFTAMFRSGTLINDVLFNSTSRKTSLFLSHMSAAMGMNEATYEVESSDSWYKIPEYNSRTAELMRQAYTSCYDTFAYPQYGQYVDDLTNDIETAQRRSERDKREAVLTTTQAIADMLAHGECLARYVLIVEGFGVQILDATVEELDFFYSDILDSDRFHNEVALLMGMPTHEHVFKYGPWADEVDRALLSEQLESMRSENKTVNNTIDAWQDIQSGLADASFRNLMAKYIGRMINSNELTYALYFDYELPMREKMESRGAAPGREDFARCKEVSQCEALYNMLGTLTQL